ncbi:MAG: MBL fold metallo-hydrolase, partial [Thauera sp.]|nr:MBL fold metallo-hydrolase [Thauera sp.]
DRPALLNWLRGFRTPPRRTFVVHGEPTAAAALAEAVERDLGWREVAVAEANMPNVLN